ncbi:MAG TPA: DEDD exonuclease domain-containing protein [Euzebyales bacterium]|nr:DEDD exonuclease domain-containing protein [Euzebyales bacterium]
MPPTLPHCGAVDETAPLRDVAFTVVDLETTGGSPASCAITEVGAVRVRGGEPEGELSTLVSPGVAIPRAITALTGISDHLVADAPVMSAVLPMLLELLRSSVLVAHNARFDVSFLDTALTRHGYPPIDLPVVCTATLARRLVHDEVRNCKLATLSRHFRTRHTPSHRALPDARATVEVLHALLERAAGVGVTTVAGLLELCRRRDLSTVTQRHRLADRLPTKPGVYAFRSAAGEVLYVGKAVDLRARVRTYFGSDPRRMVRGLLRETARIDHRVCPTAIEAEVRELRAIARWRPRFNRRSKPPKRAVWLKLTTERFPRLSIVRTIRDDDATYLGPLRSSHDAERIRDALHDALPLRRCTMRIGARTRAPACALAEMARCAAPCTGDVSPAAYGAIVAQVRAAMHDGSGRALPRLETQMTARSQAGRYREAGWRRDRLAALADAVHRQRTSASLTGVSLAAWRTEGDGRAAVIMVEDGRLVGSATCVTDEVEVMAARLSLDACATRDDGPFVVLHERLLLSRWLGAADTRLLWAHGRWAEPVAGGAEIDRLLRRLRRRSGRSRRSADELHDKRLRRGGGARHDGAAARPQPRAPAPRA